MTAQGIASYLRGIDQPAPLCLSFRTRPQASGPYLTLWPVRNLGLFLLGRVLGAIALPIYPPDLDAIALHDRTSPRWGSPPESPEAPAHVPSASRWTYSSPGLKYPA